MTQIEQFIALGLSEKTLEAIRAKGFEVPSPIQMLTIPSMLDKNKNNDIIAQAQTGTGKTAAFGLPLIEMLEPAGGPVQVLILVPTRELALQVTEEIQSFNKVKLSIAPIYGGASMTEQLRRLSKGIDIVVGTPGRILDHIRRKTLKLENLKYLILDEADEMLNMGFIEDVEEILASANDQRRILLFSATMPSRIVQLSKRYMRNVEMLRVAAQEMTTHLTDQIYFEVRENDKFDALTRIIDVEPDFYGIVFCRTKVGVDDIVHKLNSRSYSAEGLHGDVSQAQREQILRKFKGKHSNILVATDVAARGIDINNLTHVINFSLPQDTESYVHRIGRTGRAGNTGTAITFISSSEYRQFGTLQKDIKTDIKKVVLPTAQDVVEMKKGKIKDDLTEIIENENYSEYIGMAEQILTDLDPKVAMASLLRLAFKNELEESNYPEIRSINVDKRGTARLFLSIGRMDGFDARKLSQMLKRECGISDSQINDVKVMESYSFVSVPFNDAKAIISDLNNINNGGRQIAEIATDSNAGGGSESKSGRERSGGGKGYGGGRRFDKVGSKGGAPAGAAFRKQKDSASGPGDFKKNFAGGDKGGWGGKSGFDNRAAGKSRARGKR